MGRKTHQGEKLVLVFLLRACSASERRSHSASNAKPESGRGRSHRLGLPPFFFPLAAKDESRGTHANLHGGQGPLARDELQKSERRLGVEKEADRHEGRSCFYAVRHRLREPRQGQECPRRR